jgi:histidine kinase
MFRFVKGLRNSLVSKLILAVGMTFLISMSAWAFFNIRYQEKRAMEDILEGADRLANTILLGTHYAMMINSRDDINQIVTNIGKQREIENLRIYDKAGHIQYSHDAAEVGQKTNIKAEACDICHRSEPPTVELALSERTRIFDSQKAYRLLGIITPIYNEPGCSTDPCHFHPEDKKILGALDMVVSLEATDREILLFEKWLGAFGIFMFVVTSAIIFVFVYKFVKNPINRLVRGTHLIAKGQYASKVEVGQDDEMGRLAEAINKMGKEIGEKQAELNKQRDEYQNLFELVPCIITVQDRNYQLVKYNKEFAEKFDPKPGQYCYQAYKGRDKKCIVCPVEKTFESGQPHFREESGFYKDGSVAHWFVSTVPIKNEKGEIIAAMELNLDITERKELEAKLEKSEKKYHAIFSNIPNPVFVLDEDTLEILDCNESVKTVYGYSREEVVGKPFKELFSGDEGSRYTARLESSSVINQVRQMTKEGKTLYVNMRVSPCEYPGRRVLLVTTSDITKRLEAEQQLIQASKMATLGEMSTGVAHELNQPLSVIKTASGFFMKKVKKKEKIKDEILFTLAEEIDSHVDRATKIINHMREFGRKSDMKLRKIQLNEVLRKAFDIFSQQLKIRGIEVTWDIQEDLSLIMGDPSRLEQVFINLLINARDAIEDRWEGKTVKKGDKQIALKTREERGKVIAEVHDTGAGIPATVRDKIFEPFFTTKKVGKGTGLGLSISYGIIQDCGGEIRAESQDGGGATFIMTFTAVSDH